MDHAEAQAFARQWAKDWNAHHVDALLEHVTDDVVFTSPVAARILGGGGVIRGKEALRKYWSEGIRLIPDLHPVRERFRVAQGMRPAQAPERGGILDRF